MIYTSKTNPIIAGVRGLIIENETVHEDSVHWERFWRNSALYLCSGNYSNGVPITREHKDHARKVFLRLSALHSFH